MNLNDIKSAKRRGDYETALNGCNDLLTLDENEVDALKMRASIYFLMEKNKEAIEDFNQVDQVSKLSTKDLYLGADAALNIEDYTTAQMWLRRGLDMEDDYFHSSMCILLAYANMQTSKFNDALDYLKLAEDREPNLKLPIPGFSGVASIPQLKAEVIGRQQKVQS